MSQEQVLSLELMEGGGLFDGFIDWIKKLFGTSRVEKYIASNDFDPSDLVKAQGVLSAEMLKDMEEVLKADVKKKGSVAQKFMNQIIDNDQEGLSTGERAILKSQFANFVSNGRDSLTGAGRSKLMQQYNKNVSLIGQQLDMLGVDMEEKEKLLGFYKNQIISKYTMYQLTVEYIYLINVYMKMDTNFKNSVDSLKKDTVELLKKITDATSGSSRILKYQETLPKAIMGVVYNKLAGRDVLSSSQQQALSAVSMSKQNIERLKALRDQKVTDQTTGLMQGQEFSFIPEQSELVHTRTGNNKFKPFKWQFFKIKDYLKNRAQYKKQFAYKPIFQNFFKNAFKNRAMYNNFMQKLQKETIKINREGRAVIVPLVSASDPKDIPPNATLRAGHYSNIRLYPKQFLEFLKKHFGRMNGLRLGAKLFDLLGKIKMFGNAPEVLETWEFDPNTPMESTIGVGGVDEEVSQPAIKNLTRRLADDEEVFVLANSEMNTLSNTLSMLSGKNKQNAPQFMASEQFLEDMIKRLEHNPQEQTNILLKNFKKYLRDIIGAVTPDMKVIDILLNSVVSVSPEGEVVFNVSELNAGLGRWLQIHKGDQPLPTEWKPLKRFLDEINRKYQMSNIVEQDVVSQTLPKGLLALEDDAPAPLSTKRALPAPRTVRRQQNARVPALPASPAVPALPAPKSASTQQNEAVQNVLKSLVDNVASEAQTNSTATTEAVDNVLMNLVNAISQEQASSTSSTSSIQPQVNTAAANLAIVPYEPKELVQKKT